MKHQMLVVGGTWGTDAKPSYYIDELVRELRSFMKVRWDVVCCNGLGDVDELNVPLDHITKYDCVLWAPNISNEHAKLITTIKQKHPHCILIESKRNDNGKYTDKDLVAHMLHNHANLMLELEKPMPKVVMGRLLDPLGNQWLEPTAFISDVALAISRRVQTLLTYTRVPSRQLGPAEPVPQSPKLAEFMCWVKAISIQLHELMHGANQDRFLGNYAFRCLNGFPAYSNGEGKVYVSPRNVDKRGITTSDLIHVHTVIEEHPCFNLYVGYYGERKPSVDAPIQLGLFARFPYIKYMLHTHVYIEGAQTTNTIIPCGALEEVDYFNNRFPDSTSYLAVNLRGHGSIVMMDDTSLSELQRIKYVARPMPENAAPWI